MSYYYIFFQDLPFFYPINFMQFLNGSNVPSNIVNLTNEYSNLVAGVHSVIPEEEYVEMLKKQHFGMLTPIDFYGYNQDSFPFWSSEPFTYASSMLALTQYRALLDSGQLPSP